jgi:hypothetical protein
MQPLLPYQYPRQQIVTFAYESSTVGEALIHVAYTVPKSLAPAWYTLVSRSSTRLWQPTALDQMALLFEPGTQAYRR